MKKNKWKTVKSRVLSLLLLIILFLCQSNAIIYAMNYNSEELDYKPQQGQPVREEPAQNNPNTSGSIDETIEHPYFGGIEGKAYEKIESVIGQELGNNGRDSTTKNNALKGVSVELFDERGNRLGETTTADNGTYNFSRDKFYDGVHQYKIKFKYGFIDENTINNATFSNYKEIQNIIKYNIQDYKSGTQDYTINTIEKFGKSCAQVYLVLDCSRSMEEEVTLADGTRKKKIDIEKNLAKKIVNSLLKNGDKNIYIGLVVYTGECYRRVSLTNDKNILNEGIDGNFQFNNYGYTNIDAALKKAYQSFANNVIDTSNRYMFLLSDGVPTSDGNDSHKIYRDQSKAVNDENLRKIAETTKNTVKQLLDQKVNIYSVFVDYDADEQDKELINYTFNSFGQEYEQYYRYKEVITQENIDTIVNEVKVDFDKFVKSSVEITNTPNGVTEEERQKIIKIYKDHPLDFETTVIYEAIDMVVKDDVSLEKFKRYANIISKYMFISEETNITINKDPIPILPNPNPEEIKNNEGEVIGHRTHIAVPSTQAGPDLILQRYPELTLKPISTITGMGVIVSNGATLDSQFTNPEERRIILSTIKEEFLYGAKVFLQCNVAIKNQSTYTDFNKISVICYIPDGFELEKDIDNNYKIKLKGKDQNGERNLTNSKIVKTEQLDKDNISNYKVGEEVKKYIESDGGHRALKFDIEIDPNEFTLMQQGTLSIEFIISKLLANSDENMDYTLETEIFSYSNKTVRRIQFMSDTRGLVGATQGNYNKDEIDYDKSNNSIIIIPTGKNLEIYSVIGIIILLAVAVIVIHKKYIK